MDIEHAKKLIEKQIAEQYGLKFKPENKEKSYNHQRLKMAHQKVQKKPPRKEASSLVA